MSNANQAPEAPDIGELIAAATDEQWRQIKAVLAVKTRSEAVELAAADPEARKLVISILNEEDQTLLTRPGERTALTDTPTAPPAGPSAAERLYGKGAAKVKF